MKMKQIVLGLFVAFVLSACEQVLLQEPYSNTVLDNYKAFCDDFERMYGAFEAKEIKWDSLVEHHSQTLKAQPSNENLYAALCNLLHALNDGHADLYAPEFGHFRSWNRREMPYFEGRAGQDIKDVVTLQNVIRQQYLKNKYSKDNSTGWLFFAGTIDYEGRKIGYLCIPTFYLTNFPHTYIDECIKQFNACDAVVLDLRFNGGGTTEAFVGTLNRMSNESKMYLQSAFRNGSKLSDFTALHQHWTKPRALHLNADVQVAILQNAFSGSSTEHFILGMKTQKNVITVGDYSCGAFSAVLERILPNGWKYRLGAQVLYDAQGNLLRTSNGRYAEGIGLAPDVQAVNRWEDIVNDKDLVLERALEELQKSI